MIHLFTTFVVLCTLPFAASAQVNPTGKDGGADSHQLVIDTGGFRGRINSVCLSSDGGLVAAAADQDVRVWETRSRRLVATIRGERSRGNYGITWSVAFSPDGETLAVGIEDQSRDGSIRLYETQKFKQISLLAGHTLAARKLAFSGDGQWLATSTEDGQIHIWDWHAKKLIKSISKIGKSTGYKVFQVVNPVNPVVLAMNEDFKVFSIPDLQIRQNDESVAWTNMLVQLTRPDVRFTYPGAPIGMFFQAYFDLDHQQFYLTSFEEKTRTAPWAAVWKAGQQSPSTVYRGHSHPIFALNVSRDGQTAVTGDEAGNVHVWDSQRGGLINAFSGTHRQVTRVAWLKREHSADMKAIDRKLAVTFEGTRETQVLDLATRTLRPLQMGEALEPSTQLRNNVSVQVDNSQSGGILRSLVNGQRLGEWKFQTGRKVGQWMQAPKDVLGGQPTLIVADEEGGLFAWDGRRNDQLLQRTFVGHDGLITSLSTSGDVKLLASSSSDGTIRIWPLDKLNPQAELDARLDSNRIVEVFPNSQSRAAGLLVGDSILTIGGLTIGVGDELKLQKKYPHKPGSTVIVEIFRPGQGVLKKNVKLVAGGDYVEPILSYFATLDEEWIAWTPDGYYDSRAGAARMIGWLQNQGKSQDARYFSAEQVQKKYYQPGFIDRAISESGLGNMTTSQKPTANDQPPVIEFLKPISNFDVQEGEDLVVDAEIKSPGGADIESVEVWIDNSLYKQERLSRSQVRFKQALSVPPGTHTLRLVVASRMATTRSDEVVFRVAGESVASRGPLVHVLSIGISQFECNKKEKSPFSDLKFCHEDAKSFSAAVEKHKTTDLHLNVVLENERATRREIIKWFESIKESEEIQPQDHFFMFVASHGITQGKNNNYYLIPYDVDPANIAGSAITSEEIVKVFKDVKAKSKILFIDTCHSAAIMKDPTHEFTQLPVVIFSSSEARTQSLELEKVKHGAFTAALIEAMGDQVSDTRVKKGVLDIQELCEAIKAKMNKLMSTSSRVQTPVFILPRLNRDEIERTELFRIGS